MLSKEIWNLGSSTDPEDSVASWLVFVQDILPALLEASTLSSVVPNMLASQHRKEFPDSEQKYLLFF